MNEELIRQCALDVVDGGKLETTDVGRTIALMVAEDALRLYHARHVAPLVEVVRDFKEHGVIGAPDSIERMYNALSAFDTGTPQPSPDVARLVEAADAVLFGGKSTEAEELARLVRLRAALAPFQQEGK